MVFTLQPLPSTSASRADDRILNVLPLAFDYGLYQLLMAVRLGATLVLEHSFTFPPADRCARSSEHEVTVFPGVPTVYAPLLAHARERARVPARHAR